MRPKLISEISKYRIRNRLNLINSQKASNQADRRKKAPNKCQHHVQYARNKNPLILTAIGRLATVQKSEVTVRIRDKSPLLPTAACSKSAGVFGCKGLLAGHCVLRRQIGTKPNHLLTVGHQPQGSRCYITFADCCCCLGIIYHTIKCHGKP